MFPGGLLQTGALLRPAPCTATSYRSRRVGPQRVRVVGLLLRRVGSWWWRTVEGLLGQPCPRRTRVRRMQSPVRVAQTLGQRRSAQVSFSYYSVGLEACLAAGLVNAEASFASHGMRSALRACATAAWVGSACLKSAPFAVDDERDLVASRTMRGGIILF